MYWYWWAWFAIVIFLIFMPLIYGWGMRGWGPPYPRYYYRRRQLRRPPGVETPEQRSATQRSERVLVQEEPVATEGRWGIGADLLWLAVLGAAIWAIVAFAY